MIKNLEQTLLEKVDAAKEATQKKLFKEFVAASDAIERNKIGDKMDVLTRLVLEFKKEIRKIV